MGDELSLLLEIFNKIEKAGGQATLSVATDGGKTKGKLEITTTPAPPTSTSSGRRQRRRGPQARARRNQRAAAHQAAHVMMTYSQNKYISLHPLGGRNKY